MAASRTDAGVATAGARAPERALAVAGWERRLQQAALVLLRLGLAYLFFTQLWWKTPPTFGCPADFRFTTGTPQQLQRSSGLCDWIGIESVYATQPRPFFVANIDNRGAPELAIDLGWAARLNGAFIDSVVKPNIAWFGYLIFAAEAFIFVSLLPRRPTCSTAGCRRRPGGPSRTRGSWPLPAPRCSSLQSPQL